MTVGIICLDGLDHRLATEHRIFDPVGIDHQPLLNDLEGENPLFTPRVWNSLFLGEDQRTITGWNPESDWREATSDWDFIWDRVAMCSVLNANVHTGYLHQNACIPDGWVPGHGNPEQMKQSSRYLAEYWNDTLAEKNPPLQIGYWRFPDAYGHHAGKVNLDQAPIYQWIRDEFWGLLDLPDQFLVMSDHGFHLYPEELEAHAGQDAHTEHGTVAATFDLPQMQMSDWIPAWQDLVIEKVQEQHLEDLGYL